VSKRDWSSDVCSSDLRLLEEYLLGRAHGILDVSGRPVPPEGNPADFASPGDASSVFAAAPGTGPVTVVLDDPTGALVLVAALTRDRKSVVQGELPDAR